MDNYDLALTMIVSALMVATVVTGFFVRKEMKNLP